MARALTAGGRDGDGDGGGKMVATGAKDGDGDGYGEEDTRNQDVLAALLQLLVLPCCGSWHLYLRRLEEWDGKRSSGRVGAALVVRRERERNGGIKKDYI